MPTPVRAERVLIVRLPRVHPLMLLPAALLAALMLPLLLALAAAAVAALAVGGVTYPALLALHHLLAAVTTYQPRTEVTP